MGTTHKPKISSSHESRRRKTGCVDKLLSLKRELMKGQLWFFCPEDGGLLTAARFLLLNHSFGFRSPLCKYAQKSPGLDPCASCSHYIMSLLKLTLLLFITRL
ncbi:hypothetical protein GJAV_G00128870 [Gymnothorax javanicus]|nr:hypothetical protein GJAV_G00128870 [Gymnothorax javanicus]